VTVSGSLSSRAVQARVPSLIPPFRDIPIGVLPSAPFRANPALCRGSAFRLATVYAGAVHANLLETVGPQPRYERGLGCGPGWGFRVRRGKESDVAGKNRLKSLAQTVKKAPAKPKRPKKTSRGK
jgi:hypothetical protein